jgi:lipoprotein-anchoring transpeptidase ErfK/SrfK
MPRLRFVAAALLLLGVGCAPSDTVANPSSPPTGSPASLRRRTFPTGGESLVAQYPAYAATATKPTVGIFDKPGGAARRSLGNPQPSGAPLTFLVKSQPAGAWVEVYLPIRPNGSSGWVRAADVKIVGIPFRLDVLRSAHRLRLYQDGKLKKEFPVAIGTTNTPTPGGTFYLKELLVPTNAGGVYGPYAYGLSGFSNVLTSFAGGDGVIGLHGTNDPSKIGSDVSHGCIRLRNADITYLARLLPLGTPVRILA